MIKIVPGGEFGDNKLNSGGDRCRRMIWFFGTAGFGMKEAVIQTTSGIFLRFPIEEISEMKKNAKGVRGIKLGRTESLGDNPSAGRH